MFEYSLYNNTGNENSVNLILYLFLDSNGEVRLTTFGTKRGNKWHGKTNIVSNDVDNRWHTTIYPLTLSHGVSDDILKAPFEYYYKVIE